MSTLQNNELAKPPKRQFRINFYGFLLIIALLLLVVGAFALRLQSDVHSFHEAKQAQRASIVDIKAESKKIDDTWQHLQPISALRYSSAEQECIQTTDGKEHSTCLSDSIYARLSIHTDQPVLATADHIVAQLEQLGWQQRNYSVKVKDVDQKRSDIQTLPTNFQSVRFYYASPQPAETRRCLSVIYAGTSAQNPGWNGYVGKCN